MSECICKCEPSAHKKGRGCTTWYGDRNTGFGCNCSWDGQPPKERTEHHVLLLVKSADTYVNVLTKAVAGAATLVDGTVEGHGVDLAKEQKKLAEALEERNLAVAEAHRLRCIFERLDQLSLHDEGEREIAQELIADANTR